MFWPIAAATNALVLISAIATFWAVLRSPNRVTWLAAVAAGVLVIGTFTPLGLALTLIAYRRDEVLKWIRFAKRPDIENNSYKQSDLQEYGQLDSAYQRPK